MQSCPQCGFFHSEADTRCIRCGALLSPSARLNALAPPGAEALPPPRRSLPGANLLARLQGRFGRVAYFGRRWLQSELPEGISFRNPWLAFVIGLVPGAGQLYIGQPRRAGIIFSYVAVGIVLGALTWYHPFSNWILLAALMVWVYGAHNAFMTAKAINRDVTYWTTGVAFYIAWLLLLCIGLLGAQFLLGIAVIRFRHISHDEMRPYLRNGERVALEAWRYHFHAPRLGDVVYVDNFRGRRVLKLERPGMFEGDTLLINPRNYIERIVGLPGDTFERRDGVFYRNGQLAPPNQQPIVTSQLMRNFTLKAPPDQYIILMSYTGSNAIDLAGLNNAPRMDEGFIPQNWAQVCFVPRDDILARLWFVYQPPRARRWLH